MGRLVKPERLRKTAYELEQHQLRSENASKPETGDTYLERVAKYIPAEIIAFVLFANNLLKQAITDAPQGEPAKMAGFEVTSVGVSLLVLAWLMTPVYLWRVREEGDALGLNIIVAMSLFPVWAYAIDAVGLSPFVAFDGHLAAIVLGAATLISGIVRPKTRGGSQLEMPPSHESARSNLFGWFGGKWPEAQRSQSSVYDNESMSHSASEPESGSVKTQLEEVLSRGPKRDSVEPEPSTGSETNDSERERKPKSDF
jgi:hypothetical protein